MYLPERRRTHLENPKAHIVTAADLQYLFTKAILDHENQEIHLNESLPDIVERYLPKDRRDARPEQLTIFFGSLSVAKREYERRRFWESSREKHFIIDYLTDFLDHWYSDFFGIKFEGDMQRHGDIYA